MKKLFTAKFIIAIYMMGVGALAAPTLAEAEDLSANTRTAPLAEDGDMAAMKSFGAWYFKYGSEYPDFDAAWEGWLQDPDVPARFKEAGVLMKSKIKGAFSSLKQSAETLTKQAQEQATDMASDIGDALQRAKDRAQSSFDNWLNDAISGKEAPPASPGE